ncbi:hypothetical protein, partial [Serratia odorifera]|uniref:hypothetical protein n=1 Tax=Serratia odorifera TaxID=618 RepID=UPI000EEBD455
LILTVTLKDAQGNPAPGQAGTLTAETVKAANAELKGTWAETGTAGTYSVAFLTLIPAASFSCCPVTGLLAASLNVTV